MVSEGLPKPSNMFTWLHIFIHCPVVKICTTYIIDYMMIFYLAIPLSRPTATVRAAPSLNPRLNPGVRAASSPASAPSTNPSCPEKTHINTLNLALYLCWLHVTNNRNTNTTKQTESLYYNTLTKPSMLSKTEQKQHV